MQKCAAFWRSKIKRRWCLCPQLLQGDCLEEMKKIPDGSVDMILCDLPYGTTACKWDSIIPFDRLWTEYNRIVKRSAAIVLFAAQPFTTKLIYSNLKNFRYCWYWKKNNKTGGAFCKYQPMRCVEDICVFYRKTPVYNPQGLKILDKPIINKSVKKKNGLYDWHGKDTIQRFTGYPAHMLEFKNDAMNKNRLHPTQKPVRLLEYLIKTYTNPGETVLDNCMGSGSTGEAAIRTGRRFIGMPRTKQNENMKKGKAKQFITGEKAAESGRRGGIASGKAKRKKKALAEMARAFADLSVNAKQKKQLKEYGVSPEDMTHQMALVAAMFEAGENGSVKAAALIAEWLAESSKQSGGALDDVLSAVRGTDDD